MGGVMRMWRFLGLPVAAQSVTIAPFWQFWLSLTW